MDHKHTIIHLLHSLDGGGTERTLISLLRAFESDHLRHVVITLRDVGSQASKLPDHVACCSLGISGRSRTAGFKLARAVRYWRGEVLHARNVGTWNDAIVTKLLSPRLRLVLGFHGLESAQPFTLHQRRTARRGLWLGARYTSVSSSGCKQLSLEADIPENRITRLSNGVQLDRFRNHDPQVRRWIRNSLFYDDSDFVIGIVGSLTRVKDHKTLLTAVSRLVPRFPHLRLLIVGDGPLRDVLTQVVNELGLDRHVRFVGQREDIPDLLCGLDAYVCSSASEGMNNALLEAMASGLPVVATNVGDNAQVVRNQSDGFIVERNSVDSLMNALVLYVESEDIRDHYASAAYSRAEDFDFTQTVEAYQDFYQASLPATRRGSKMTSVTNVIPPAAQTPLSG